MWRAEEQKKLGNVGNAGIVQDSGDSKSDCNKVNSNSNSNSNNNKDSIILEEGVTPFAQVDKKDPKESHLNSNFNDMNGDATAVPSKQILPSASSPLPMISDAFSRIKSTLFFDHENASIYPKEFYDHLSLGYTYSGCSGNTLTTLRARLRHLCRCTSQSSSSPSDLCLAEDFILFTANNHSLLSCLLAPDGSSYSRSQRRLVFLMRHIVSFFLQCFAGSCLSIVGVPPEGLSRTVFSVLVIVPASTIISKIFRSLIGCTVVTGQQNSSKYKEKYWLAVKWGQFMAFALFGLAFVSLFFASIFSTQHYLDVILNYCVQVILVSFFMEIFVFMTLFAALLHINVSVLYGRVTLWTMGKYYCEKLIYDAKKPNEDFFVFKKSILRGFVQVDIIMNKDRAMLWGWLHNPTEVSTTSPASNPTVMPGANTGKKMVRGSVFTSENPMSMNQVQIPRVVLPSIKHNKVKEEKEEKEEETTTPAVDNTPQHVEICLAEENDINANQGFELKAVDESIGKKIVKRVGFFENLSYHTSDISEKARLEFEKGGLEGHDEDELKK